MQSNIYLLLKFLHVAAAIGMFACWGYEWLWIILQSERNQKIDDTMSGDFKKIERLQTACVLTLVGTGIWLSITTWGFVAWIVSAVIAIAIMELLASLITRYAVSLKDSTKSSEDSSSSMHHLLAKSALKFRIAIGFGIVALMTLKPPTILLCACFVSASVLAGGIWALTDIKKQSVPRSL